MSLNTSGQTCLICNKVYSSYKSLWTHNKKFHNTNIIKNNEIQDQEIQNNCIFECRICSKLYKHKQSIYKHEKNCTGLKQTDKEIELEKCKTINLDKEQDTEKMKQDTLKLQIKLQGMKRMNTKTFKSMNKFLMDRSTNTQNIQNITNNYQIMQLGNENLVHNLSRNEKRMILDSRHNSIEKMIEIVHCGTHNRFKNIIITNLKDKFAYRYDDKKGYFITENKSDLLDNLIMYRVMDIEAIYDELSSANKIDSRTKKLIQEFLDKMDNEEPFIYDTVEYPNFKCYKMNNIKILLYNNHDKITKDIAFLIGDSKKEGEIPKNEIIS